MESKNKLFYLVCHNIRSAYNIGSIFRTADALGIDKIILGGYSPTPVDEKLGNLNQKISKVSLGAEKSIFYEKIWQTWQKLKYLKEKGFNIVALEQTKNAINFWKFKPEFPLVLVLGSEKRGISKQILKYCDKAIYIPMFGKKKSLNVSVAFAVAGYQIIKNLNCHNNVLSC